MNEPAKSKTTIRSKTTTIRFLLGMFGSLLVESFRLYKIETQLPSLFHHHLAVILGSAVLVVLGGLFTVAWAEDQPLKAIYVGASFSIWLSYWSHVRF